MNIRRIIIVIVFIILAIFGIFIYIYIKQVTPKYKWGESYSYKSKEPYGTKLLYNMLKKNVTKSKFKTIDKSVEKQLPLKVYASNYFFIGNYIMEDTAEMQHLLSYVEKGNKAFIFTNNPPEYLLKQLTGRYLGYDYYNDTIIGYNYYNDTVIGVHYPDDTNSLYFKHRFLKHNVYHDWCFIENEYFYDTLVSFHNFTPLSFVDGNHVNYFSVEYGKGKFYFNSLPIIFSNYHLIRDEGYKNAKKCFKYFHNGTIYWDERNKITTNYSSINMPDSSPLRYILSQKSFSWAWYIGIALVLLYVFFRSKREQRIIPIINPTKNTSLEFSKAISVLYYQTKDNTIIAEEIMKMFLVFIKNKYGININFTQYEVYVPQLAVISEISEKNINDIFKKSITANYGDKTDKDNLVNFHRSIEYFYKNCK